MKNMDLQIFAEPNVPSNPITPEINYETEAFINTSPAEGQPTWASLANLTTNMAQSLNEVIQQLTYYADKGWGSSEVRYAKDRKIIKVKSDGTEENLFNSKNNESSIWEKIPAGLSIVSWNGAFGFDIILFNERGTPRWTSR